MLSFKHPNVMSLIGMCFDGEMPLLIMPYMSNGSVLVYVKQNTRELLLDCEVGDEKVIIHGLHLFLHMKGHNLTEMQAKYNAWIQSCGGLGEYFLVRLLQ